MAQPTMQFYGGKWLALWRARFVRTTLNQDWELTVPADGWVTILQAAMLIGVNERLVAEWIRDERLDPAHLAQIEDSGTVMVHLPLVRAIYEHRRDHGPVGPLFSPP